MADRTTALMIAAMTHGKRQEYDGVTGPRDSDLVVLSQPNDPDKVTHAASVYLTWLAGGTPTVPTDNNIGAAPRVVQTEVDTRVVLEKMRAGLDAAVSRFDALDEDWEIIAEVRAAIVAHNTWKAGPWTAAPATPPRLADLSMLIERLGTAIIRATTLSGSAAADDSVQRARDAFSRWLENGDINPRSMYAQDPVAEAMVERLGEALDSLRYDDSGYLSSNAPALEAARASWLDWKANR